MRPLRDLTPKPSPTLRSNSETTGLPSQKTTPAKTGLSIGALGSKTTSITTAQDLGRALAGASPDTTDLALEASLTLLLGSKPVPIWEDKTTEFGWEGVVTNYALPSLTPETQSRAISMAEQSLKPMTPSECIGLLGEMKLLTVPRTEATESLEAQLMLYSRKLQDYPADVVRRVLTTQPNISKWWPAWSELKERLDLFTFRRRKLIEALKSGKSSRTSSVEPKPVPLAEMPTPRGIEDAVWQRAKDFVARKYGHKAVQEPLAEPTPEEMEKRRQEILAMCEEAERTA